MYKFILLLLLILSTSLFGNRRTDVLDAFEETDPWDFNIEVKYKYNYQDTKLKREYYCNADNDQDPNCQYDKMKNNGIVNANNFKYKKQEHIITPKLRFGLYKNVELSFALPIYLSSTRTLDFDKVARKAASTDDAGLPIDNPTHNGAGNTFWNLERTGGQDIFFPYKYEKMNDKFNTQQMTDSSGDPIPNRYTNDMEDFDTLNYTRSGLKTLDIALKWGILDNDTDSSDPSWVLGVEYKIPVASSVNIYEEKKLNQIANRPAPDNTPYTSSQVRGMLNNKIDLSETTMGDGVHWLRLSTALSKRYAFVSPVFEFWFENPFVFGNSIFKSHENREYYKPGKRFGFTVATDFIPWERFVRDPNTEVKNVLAQFSVSIGADFFHNMKGMELSEVSDFIGTTTVVDGYSSLSLFIDLSFMPTNFIRLTTGFNAGYTTDHLISDQGKGIDHNKNDILEDSELDPMYKDNKILFNSINSIGTRIQATETLNLSAYFNFAVQF